MKIDTSIYKDNSKGIDSTSQKKSFWNRDISFSNRKMNDKLKDRFYSDFLTLLKAGIDVQHTLEILTSDKKNKKYLDVIVSIEKELVRGKTLSQSMNSTGHFTKYEVNSIKIGEETGNLLLILEQLSQFFQGKIKLRKLIIKALSYPSFIFLVSFLVVIFMLNYVVPMFEDVFVRFDKELPPLTLNILKLSDFIQNYIGYILLVLVIIVSWFYFQRNKLWFRRSFSAIILRIPFFGGLMKQIYLARFYQFMYLLTNAKHNLVDSVNLVKEVIGFYPIEKALEKTEEDLRKGEFLHTSLAKSNFFESRFLTLVRVAENSNQLDSMFEKLSSQEQENVELKTETMGSILEPTMIIVVGSFVALILIAMYVPLLNLGNLFE